jgi:hypothetical protein
MKKSVSTLQTVNDAAVDVNTDGTIEADREPDGANSKWLDDGWEGLLV